MPHLINTHFETHTHTHEHDIDGFIGREQLKYMHVHVHIHIHKKHLELFKRSKLNKHTLTYTRISTNVGVSPDNNHVSSTVCLVFFLNTPTLCTLVYDTVRFQYMFFLPWDFHPEYYSVLMMSLKNTTYTHTHTHTFVASDQRFS